MTKPLLCGILIKQKHYIGVINVGLNDYSKIFFIDRKSSPRKRIPYMDAIVWYCEKNEMEIEVAAKLCNNVIKEKLRYEAEELNFLERPARLPI